MLSQGTDQQELVATAETGESWPAVVWASAAHSPADTLLLLVMAERARTAPNATALAEASLRWVAHQARLDPDDVLQRLGSLARRKVVIDVTWFDGINVQVQFRPTVNREEPV